MDSTRTIDLTDLTDTTETDTENLEVVALELGRIRLFADMLGKPGPWKTHEALAARISEDAGRLQRILRGMAGGVLVLALAVAGVALAPSSDAQAAEAGPVAAAVAWAPVYPVVLDRTFVTVRVIATTYNVTPRGQFCASVWGPTSYGQGFVGRACSDTHTFMVPVTLDARYVPLGRSTMHVTDDAAPLMAAPVAVTLDARRPSRFGVGTYTDMGRGQLFVSAPVRHYSPTAGTWLPSKLSPVCVQVWTRRGWRTRGTLTTNTSGLAAGLVTVGGGIHQVRLVRPAGVTVWGTAGRTRIVTVTTEPLDII